MNDEPVFFVLNNIVSFGHILPIHRFSGFIERYQQGHIDAFISVITVSELLVGVHRATTPQRGHIDAFISVITVSELLVGVHRATTPQRRAKRAAFVEAILSRIPAISFTSEVERVHAEIFSELSKQGNMIGAHDLLIAATALAHGYPVMMGNTSEFNRVAGLRVIGPFEAS